MKTADVKRWPQEAQDLAARLRQDFPGEPIRWAACPGPEKEPHDRELYVGLLEAAVCPLCAAEIPTRLLEETPRRPLSGA